MDSTIAEQLALVAESKIVLTANDKVIASTFSSREESELQHRILARNLVPGSDARETIWGTRRIKSTSVAFYQGSSSPVQCYVFIPLERPMSFIRQFNRTILIVGISAVLLALLLLRFVAGTITRPLDNLVAGVRALAAGDYTYSITPRGSSRSRGTWANRSRKCAANCWRPSRNRLKQSESPRWAERPVPSLMICVITLRLWWPMRNSSTKPRS